MSAVGRRYARGAVAAAEEQVGPSGADELLAGVLSFQEALRTSHERADLLVNPVLKAQRAPVLKAVLDKMALQPQASALVRMLSDNNRMPFFADVVGEVQAIADEKAGRARAHVQSAIPLAEAQIKRISRALERRVGRKVVVNVEVEPALLGGLVCRVGDLTLDTSLRRQLQVLREQLEGHSI